MTELLLPQSVQRNIGDKLYDKRKQAALDVEQVVKGLAASGNRPRIQSLIDKLVHEYTFSPQANLRKGGLLCLAATAVGLAGAFAPECLPPEFAKEFLPQIVRPVLHSFKDQDHRVRYYGCEALYNIAKVAQEALIFHFQAVFEGVFKLYADSEPQVQEAAKILDNLVKDIVTACSDFDIREFIPMLKRCLTVVDSHKRQFLISWVRALDSVPDMDLLAWLPELLHGLFAMLADLSREIRHQASKVLQEFLCQLPAAPTVNFQALTPIVVEEACSTNDFVHLTALKWLQVFVEEAPRSMVQQVAPMLGVVMPSVSSSNREIRDAASQVSSSLLRALTAVTSAVSSTAPDATAQELDMVAVLKVVSHELQSKHEASRLEALRWLQFLLQLRQAAVVQELPLLVPALLDALTASSERVVNESLAVQAAIAEDDVHFRDLLFNLISRFRGQGGPALLQARGMLVVRRLAALLGGRRVYEALACILESEPDRQFASLMVQALNLILLTAPELQGLRMMLRGAMHQKDGADLLKALYRCWSQNAGSLIALCLLAQAYQHACDLLHSFADLPITSNLLVQLDRLVQLLETPAFTQMRLHLLQPAQQPALVRALYALLMLLPQSAAFRTLHSRLDAVPTVALMQLTHASSGGAVPDGAGVPPASSSPAASTLPAKHSARELPAANALGVGLNGDDGIDFAELLQVFRMQQRQVSGPGYIATSPSSCSLLISPQESGEDATS